MIDLNNKDYDFRGADWIPQKTQGRIAPQRTVECIKFTFFLLWLIWKNSCTRIIRRPWTRATQKDLTAKSGGGVSRMAVIGFFEANGKKKVKVPLKFQSIVEEYKEHLFH